MKKVFAFVLVLLSSGMFLFSQKSKDVTPKGANDKFVNGNYEDALEDYLVLLNQEPKNEKYNYRTGVCYLNSNVSKAKAVPYLEIVTRITKTEFDAWYLLGRAYMFAFRYDDAIKTFNAFKDMNKGKLENINDVARQIQFCLNAKELLNFGMDMSFDNLGAGVNSEYNDFYPFIPSDESFLIFNSRRPEGGEEKQPDGAYTSRIYISKVKDGIFMNAQPLGKLVEGRYDHEEVIGLSSKGDILLIYAEDFDGNGDIFISYSDESRNFKTATKLPETINSSKGAEIAASISSDGSTIYFASDRSGGLGGTDLYMSKKLPNGSWGPAQNLGPTVNTPKNEDFPNISPDSKTLFFSSDGHTSMGGYDIFKAEADPSTGHFGQPRNLGFPINSSADNMNFRISDNGRYGYIAALREKGLGDYDIYRVTFNEVDPEYTVFTGIVGVNGGKKVVNYTDVLITVTNSSSQEIVGNYLPNPFSGKYVIILPPGEYEIMVDAPGYVGSIEKIKVLDKSSYVREIQKDIMLNVK
ncbi:MAG: PD40 domain-containing protein [Bacteroidia bacterium]|nr:PD40 domain-containing protein [Bacteroidia bacterium]